MPPAPPLDLGFRKRRISSVLRPPRQAAVSRMTIETPLLKILVALGIGLLIGIERERTNMASGGAAAAGLRTFSIAALIGASAALVDGAVVLPVVVAGVG